MLLIRRTYDNHEQWVTSFPNKLSHWRDPYILWLCHPPFPMSFAGKSRHQRECNITPPPNTLLAEHPLIQIISYLNWSGQRHLGPPNRLRQPIQRRPLPQRAVASRVLSFLWYLDVFGGSGWSGSLLVSPTFNIWHILTSWTLSFLDLLCVGRSNLVEADAAVLSEVRCM